MKQCIALLVIVGTLLAALLGGPHSTATAQGSGWSAPVQVSGTTKSSWFPDIAVDTNDKVHIVWASGTAMGPNPKAEDGVDLLMYRTLKDGKWSAINDIANPGTGGYATRNSMVAGRDGNLHLLVRSQLRVDYLHAPLDSALSFQSWSSPQKINNLTTPYYGTLAMDSKGVLHALWNEAVNDATPTTRPECPSCTDVFYRHSTNDGASWSEPINISQMPEGSVKPQIKIDKQDHLHVVWEEGYDTLTGQGPPTAGVYRRSRDGGKTWDAPVRFVLPSLTIDQPTPNPSDATLPTAAVVKEPDAPRQVAVGLYNNTDPLVVFRAAATSRIYYATSRENGSSWNSAVPIDGIFARDKNDTPWDSYSLATDGAGNVHLVLVGILASETTNPPVPRVLHLVWNGQAWSAPEVIDPPAQYPAQAYSTPDQKCNGKPAQVYPEWPRIAIGDGNTLHSAWFTRDTCDRFKSDDAHYQVWYSTKKLDVAAVAPLPTFTPAPTVATAQPTALPTPAPIPTLTRPAALAVQLSDPKQWERPGMRLVGLAALPVISFLGFFVVVGLVIRRRR